MPSFRAPAPVSVSSVLRVLVFPLVLPLALVSVAPLTAFAQGGAVGSIVGSAYDQTGAPLKGVKIQASSPTQIGGRKTAYSNDEGYFRFPGLQPGVFEVIASAPGMQQVVQKGVNVGLTAPAEVTFVMEVKTAEETVKVLEKAPMVSTTTAAVKEVYDEEFVDNLPVEWRTAVEDTVGKSTAGVVNSGIRSARIRGGGQEQNYFMVEGFYMNGQKVTMKSLAAMEVQTAGYGAEFASVPGGVVNMVTKSGSNKFEVDVNGFHEDSNLTFFEDDLDSEAHSYFTLINPSFSGPIIKDRLWYFVNLEGRAEKYGREKDAEGTLPDPEPRIVQNARASTKLTWQVTPRNKLQTYTNYNWNQYHNDADPVTHENDAQKARDLRDYFGGITWEALLSDNLYFKSQVGAQRFHHEDKPQNCRQDPVDCDHIPQLRTLGAREVRNRTWDQHTVTLNESVELINTLEWFPTTTRWGEHDLKLVSRIYSQRYEQAVSTPGDYYEQWSNGAPDRKRTYFSNDPRLDAARYGWWIRGSRGTRSVTSLQDSVRLTRYLTLNPGMALTTITASTAEGRDLPVETTALTPHVSFAWDATHDGRTVLRGSFNNYVDADAIRIARFMNGDRVSQECRWDEATGEYSRSCVFSGGASGRTIGSPCGPTGVDTDGTPCRNRLKIPRTWEYTTGAEREIVKGIALGADLVYRLYTSPYERQETNRIWSPSGSALEPLGGYRNGRDQTIEDLGTPASARRRYLGITASAHKREGALKLQTAYTWSRLEGNVFDNESNEYGDIPPRDVYLYGYLPDDARHNIKISSTYSWTRWLSTGVSYSYTSGVPYQRRYRNDVTGSFADYRAGVGINPGSNVNSPDDDRPLRLPDIQRMNLQVRVRMKQLTGIDSEVYGDFFNLMALRTTTSVETNEGPTWGTPRNRLGPMKLRLGFRFKY